MREIGKQARFVTEQGISQFVEFLETGCIGLPGPGLKKVLGRLSGGEVPEPPHFFLEQVGLVEGFVEFHDMGQFFQCAFLEAFKGAKQEESGALDDAALFAGQ